MRSCNYSIEVVPVEMVNSGKDLGSRCFSMNGTAGGPYRFFKRVLILSYSLRSAEAFLRVRVPFRSFDLSPTIAPSSFFGVSMFLNLRVNISM